MKKQISTILAALMLTGCMTACSGKPIGDPDKLQIVTTIFPEYDWVMNVLGDKAGDAEVTMLLDKQVDMHSYQPTTEDIVVISTCDVFIYVGGESDAWVEDALDQATNGDMVVVNLMDELGDAVREEETVEGMEAGESEDEDEIEYDEHVWLSLRNAGVLVNSIAAALAEADPDNADTYAGNAASYNDELAALDSEYQSLIDGAPTKTLLFGDRFPFRYLVEDYALSYYAAFAGCSAETEASFKTITFLAGKVDELSLDTVLVIENSDDGIARTIIENTGSGDAQILTLDSMQSATLDDYKNGTTYLSIMRSNLSVLEQALY